jgi:hypothetical protein
LFFGLGLGSGLYTRVVVPTFYLLLLWPLVSPGLLWPALIWAGYGLSRSVPVWWLSCTADPAEVCPAAHRVNLSLISRASWMHRANALILAVVAAWLTRWGAGV